MEASTKVPNLSISAALGKRDVAEMKDGAEYSEDSVLRVTVKIHHRHRVHCVFELCDVIRALDCSASTLSHGTKLRISQRRHSGLKV